MKAKKCVYVLFMVVMSIIASSVLTFASDKGSATVASQNSLRDEVNVMGFIQDAEFHRSSDGSFVFEKEHLLAVDKSEKEISKETVVIFPLNATARMNLQETITKLRRAGGSGSQDMDDWDSSGSIQAHLIVNYKLSEVDGIEYVKLTSVEGYHSGVNSGVSVKKQEVTYGSDGFYKGGYQSKFSSYSPKTRKWRKTAPSSWKPVATSAKCTIGGNYRLTVGRGSSTWSFEVVNNIYDN